ncbi:MAG: RHS repeat domain-containing protein, partial [Steroidobacteraceae bacterium]
KVTQGGTVDWRHTVFADGQAVAVYSRKSSGVNTLTYLLRDALGSVDALTDGSGAVVVRESFGAFGNRRGPAWSGTPSSGDLATIDGLTRRGYTGHEMLDSTDLIHMNGRVYDPVIARFVSADPFVSRVLNSQGWNRYSYVLGNPLSVVDPSGFADDKVVLSWTNGDQIPADRGVEIVYERNGLETVMAYGERDFGIIESIFRILDIPRPGGGHDREENGGGDGGLDVVEVTGKKPPRPSPQSPQAPAPQSQQPGACKNGSIGVGGALQGPLIGPFGVGASANVLAGVSYGGSLLDSRVTVQGQISGLLGTGIYGGFGITAQGGPGNIAQGWSTSTAFHSEVNFGAAASGSLSVDIPSQGPASAGGWSSRLPGGRIGVGLGFAVGAGPSGTLSYASPSLRQAINAFGALLGLDRNLLGPPGGCQ